MKKITILLLLLTSYASAQQEMASALQQMVEGNHVKDKVLYTATSSDSNYVRHSVKHTEKAYNSNLKRVYTQEAIFASIDETKIIHTTSDLAIKKTVPDTTVLIEFSNAYVNDDDFYFVLLECFTTSRKLNRAVYVFVKRDKDYTLVDMLGVYTM